MDEVIKKMTLDMMVKFEKYWTDHSVVLSFGAILDPRLKDKFLKYCYARLDASTCEEKLKNVLDKFRGLYEEYVSYYCNQSTSLSQSLCETSSLSREGNKTKKSKIAIVCFIAFDHIHKLDMFANADRFHELYESHDHVLYFSYTVLMGVFKNSTNFIVCLKMEMCHEMIICYSLCFWNITVMFKGIKLLSWFL